MASERIIVGIDVGTTKICTLISSVTDDDQLEIIGAGVTPSRGLRKGVVVNVDEAMEAIEASVSKAEQQSGFKIVSAYVGISGAHTQSTNGQGVVAVRRSDHQISDEDVGRVLEAARTITLAPEREIIHIIPRHYIVDGQEGITNPVTMVGHRLEVETTIVTGMVNAIHNLTRCIERLDIGIDELVLQSLAAGEAILTPAEKDLGVALIDLGGGTSDLAVYQDGAVAYATSLPIGGSHISNDIAIGLRTPLAAAEEIKIRHGHAVIDSVEEGKTIDVAAFDTGEGRAISRRLLNSIIADRLTETFELLYEQLRRAGYSDPLPAGIVLAGGTAQMAGIRRIAAEVFQSPIRVGTPSGMFGLVDSVATPAFATSVGLLKWGLTQMDEHGYNGSNGLGNSLGRVVQWLRGFFP
jgi:cell division protein FtsA